jgi:LDH2 family malate/lactate/ureidoglycolate dehydrogenase
MTAVSLSEARIRAHELLLQAHVPADYARIIEDHYLGNEVLGKSSHGVVRLPGVLKGIHRDGPGGAMRAAETSGQSKVFDANCLPGVVAVTLATESMITHLQGSEDSILAAGVTNYQQGTGVLGRYVFALAEAGYIGIAMANSWALVAPPGGREPMIGTNPIAAALPTEGDPLVVDVSTSATSYGAILVNRANDEPVPAGVVLDAEGRPSREPDDADDGAMLALGDHKGFGLGLIVELMAGALIGAESGPARKFGRKDGTLLIAIRPNSFGSSTFAAHVSALCKTISDSAPRAGSDNVRTPGINYRLLREPIAWPDTVDVPDAAWQQLLGM